MAVAILIAAAIVTGMNIGSQVDTDKLTVEKPTYHIKKHDTYQVRSGKDEEKAAHNNR